LAVFGQPGVHRRPGHPERLGDLVRVDAVLDLADRADAQLLQGLVVELAAVVVTHAKTRPDCHPKSSYL
jgi:hypothetical protein